MPFDDPAMPAEPTKDQIEAWRREHGDLYRLRACGVTVLVKAADEQVFEQYLEYGRDPERRGMASEKLVRATLLWPARAEFDALVRRKPGLFETFGNECAEIAGLTRKVEREKL